MNDEWRTPQYLFDWIQEQISFEMLLDLAADKKNTKCMYFITKEMDALTIDWHKYLNDISYIEHNSSIGAFCNPPYSRPNLELFMRKALYHNIDSCFIVPLDLTGWSRNYVWNKTEVWIPDERICFIDPNTGVPENQPAKGSMIVIHGQHATPGLIKAVHIPKPAGGL